MAIAKAPAAKRRTSSKPATADAVPAPVATEPVKPVPVKAVATKPAVKAAAAKAPAVKATAAKAEAAAKPAKSVVKTPIVADTPAAPAPVVAPPKPVAAVAPSVKSAPIAAAAEKVAEKVMTKVTEPVIEAPASVAQRIVASISPKPFNSMVKYMATLSPTPPFKGYDDVTAFGKANLDAFIQANQVFAKGIEELSKEVMSLTQVSLENAAAAAKAIFQAKSIKDVVELNADYTKTSFDKFVANSTKLSELGVKVATDALAPVTARVNVAVSKITKPAA
jgi:phasin family protein